VISIGSRRRRTWIKVLSQVICLRDMVMVKSNFKIRECDTISPKELSYWDEFVKLMEK
jgi:hypothetical protein